MPGGTETSRPVVSTAQRHLAVADHIRDLEQRRPFAYAKINHGLWDGMARVERMRARGVSDPREIDRQPWGLPGFLESGFHDELQSLVRRIPEMRADVRFGAGLFAFPDNDRWDLAPEEPIARVRAAMDQFLRGVPLADDGLTWKRAVIDGSIVDLCRALRGREVVLVGPGHLRHFGAFAALPRFRFVKIPGHTALLERTRIAAALRGTHRPEADPVYLIQAGPLSVWLALTLAEELANATFLDLGIVLDLCLLDGIGGKLWARFFRGEVAASILAINPSWPDDARAFASDCSPAERRTSWRGFSGGILPDVAETAGLPERTSGLGSFDRPELAAGGMVRYVESKRIDWQRVHEILALSRDANQWTNFGPVSLALERALHRVLKLPADRAVVMCASASAGLTALAGLHAARLGRPLRWVVSAYTFAVQRTGVFAGATIVDCDESGLIDLAAVDALPQRDWDGMIVTNLFGTLPDSRRFQRFCAERGKALIIDSAAALLGLDRGLPDLPEEVVSFHHTKPWGVGEGGCVIVDSGDVALVRSALNFGMGGPDLIKPFAGNGKISEFACALILDRLERLPGWSHYYAGQRRRIDKLRRHAGLPLLCRSADGAIAANVPILAARPVTPRELAGAPFDVGKYYPPLAAGFPNATRLFAHVVNVPAHAGMAAVPSEAIETMMRALATPPRGGLVHRLVERLLPRAR